MGDTKRTCGKELHTWRAVYLQVLSPVKCLLSSACCSEAVRPLGMPEHICWAALLWNCPCTCTRLLCLSTPAPTCISAGPCIDRHVKKIQPCVSCTFAAKTATAWLGIQICTLHNSIGLVKRFVWVTLVPYKPVPVHIAVDTHVWVSTCREHKPVAIHAPEGAASGLVGPRSRGAKAEGC